MYSPFSRPTAATLLVLLIVQVVYAQPAQPPALRYHLSPGQHLTYESTSKSSGSFTSVSTAAFQAWVLQTNADGSWRILLVQDEQRQSQGRAMPSETQAISFDLKPDGSIQNAIRTYRIAPQAVFPTLPPQSDAQQWTGNNPFGELTRYAIKGKDGSVYRLEAVADSDMEKIYLAKSTSTLNFDVQRGYVTSSSSVGEQGWSSKSEFSGQTKLAAADTVDATQIAKMAADDAAYSQAINAFTDLMSGAETDASKIDPAKVPLESARPKLQTDIYRKLMDQQLDSFRSESDYLKNSAGKFAAVLNKPSPQWEYTDLTGKTYKLADLKGKVVVLDFWYRGCGWCIRAMPKIKQVVEDFKDKPVAIFGMNTDQVKADAQFTVDTMKLNYPTLMLGTDRSIVEKYGVQGFPTLIIIGPDGVVRDIHVGWSPAVREDVGKRVAELLGG